MNFFKKSSLFLVAALVAAPALSACSSHDEPSSVDDAGSLGLRLLVGGRQVNTVHYEIKRADGTSLTAGDLNVASASTLSFRIGGLPAGNNYSIVLSALTVDGVQTCEGSATFNVVAGTVTAVQVRLNCRDLNPTTGSIDVNGTFNQCPTVSAVIAFPLIANVGEVISLSAGGTDIDAGPSAITYSWQEGGVEFATTAAATYNCAVAGDHDLSVVVNDGQCTGASEDLVVKCVAATCGNGTTETALGEECDDSNTADGDGCDHNCQLEPFCGDSSVDVGLGEQCDDGNDIGDDACGNDCLLPVCGDGTREGAEACDDGNVANGDGCNASCLVEGCGDGVVNGTEQCDDANTNDDDACGNDCVLPVCGDGQVEGAEVCDDGNTVDTDACKNDCSGSGAVVDGRFLGRPATCQPCVQEFCTEEFWGIDVLAACPSTDAACTDILNCEWSQVAPDPLTNCVSGSTLSVSCFCGPIDAADCATRPLTDPATTGQCKASIISSLGATNNTEAFDRMLDTTYGAGRAHQLANCAASFCPEQCGL